MRPGPAPELAGDTELARLSLDVLENLHGAVLVCGIDGEVLHANRASRDLLGKLQRGSALLDGLSDNDELRAALGSALVSQSGAAFKELTVKSAAWGDVAVELRTTPLLRADGRAYALLFQLDNVSAARRRDAEIRRLERLAALGRFTSTVAHEVRNPLAGIGAGVQYLAKTASHGPEERETIAMILEEIKRLDRIVGDIFHAGRPPQINLQMTDIHQPIERAVGLARELASQRGVQITLHADPSLPAIEIDGERIEQVMLNLLKNAAEASEAGGTVAVRTSLAAGTPLDGLLPSGAHPNLSIEVSDRGSGMSREQLSQVFEPFYSARSGGTGLGLYVTQMIINAHSGKIHVESVPGEGSTFQVLLPYKRERAGGK